MKFLPFKACQCNRHLGAIRITVFWPSSQTEIRVEPNNQRQYNMDERDKQLISVCKQNTTEQTQLYRTELTKKEATQNQRTIPEGKSSSILQQMVLQINNSKDGPPQKQNKHITKNWKLSQTPNQDIKKSNSQDFLTHLSNPLQHHPQSPYLRKVHLSTQIILSTLC